MNDLKIGVFDSGVGGLTVLKGLQEALPRETFIYIGDNLHSPYGQKTHAQLLEYTTEIVRYFISQNVKMIVLACNTTSCVVLEDLRKLFPQMPMLGVTDSTCELVKKDEFTKVCIMATLATINSNAYQHKIGIDKTIGLPCPNLVPLIEEGASKEAIIDELHQLLDGPMKECDGIVLGCTHYPIVASDIASLYPQAKLYSSSEAIVKDVTHYLEKNDLKAKNKGKSVVYTTGDLFKFVQSASAFFDFKNYDVEMLEIEVV